MNKKRLQVILSDEAWVVVERLTTEANHNFETGNINYSDAINEMIIAAKVDIKALQMKHMDIRKSLRVFAAKENVDLGELIKAFSEMKARSESIERKLKTSSVAVPKNG